MRASIRALINKAGFTIVVVLILAFGIATNTAIFSVVNGVLLPALKEKIREADKNQAFSSIATIDQLVERSLNRRRFNLLLLGSFAVLALILEGVGLYGLISFMTAQRTHEIGIRMAFGADPRDVLKLIIGQGMTLTLAGIVIGLLALFALTRLMQSLKKSAPWKHIRGASRPVSEAELRLAEAYSPPCSAAVMQGGESRLIPIQSHFHKPAPT